MVENSEQNRPEPDWKDYLAIARPDHWFKNVFMVPVILLVAFFDSSYLGWGALPGFVLGFVAACLIASSNYVINEILDAPTDRHHPVKRFRPIPAGEVDRVAQAVAEAHHPVVLAVALVLALIGLATLKIR